MARNSVFNAVVHFNREYQARLSGTELEFYHAQTGEVRQREELSVHAVAIKANNGVLFAGNVVFFERVRQESLSFSAGCQPILILSDSGNSWNLQITGCRDDDDSSIVLHYVLQNNIVELSIVGDKLLIKVCPMQ